MSEEIKIEVVGKISRVDVRPGDMFVLHFPGPVSAEAQDAIRRTWTEKWGPDSPLLLCVTDGAQLGVIRREDLEAAQREWDRRK